MVASDLDIEVFHTSAFVTSEEKIDNLTNLFHDKDGNEMLWEPGAMSYETFTAKNVGSVALKYILATSILDFFDGIADQAEPSKASDRNIVAVNRNILKAIQRGKGHFSGFALQYIHKIVIGNQLTVKRDA